MHDTAYENGRLFFQLYGAFGTVVELGSQDVNGALRDHAQPGTHYIGLDVMPAKGVDLVINPDAPLPLASESADAIVTSSAFEHDVCFWDTFLELIRVLRPGGLLYVNAPSNGAFHRYPLDCWRFYPDAGPALVRWAARRGTEVELVESFIGRPKAEQWADFVAVFRKAGGAALTRKGCIADHVNAINIYDPGTQPGAPLRAEAGLMPDMQTVLELRAALEAADQKNAALSAEVAAVAERHKTVTGERAAAQTLAADLRSHLTTISNRITELEANLAGTTQELAALRESTSWRMTAGLRGLMILLRGH